MLRKLQVLVIGDSVADEEKARVSYEIGRFIARQGWTLITGGRGGVMEYASRGAIEEGGLVVSIIPDEDMNKATPYSSVVIATGIGYARNYINVLSADIVVAVGGGSGTLSEIAYAWQFGKPIIACAFVDGWSKELAGKKVDYRREDVVIPARSLEELFEILLIEARKILEGEEI